MEEKSCVSLSKEIRVDEETVVDITIYFRNMSMEKRNQFETATNNFFKSVSEIISED